MSKYGFIGTGSMAGALVAAAAAGGFGADCMLYNRTAEKARALARQYGCAVAESAAALAARCDYIFLGVKPHQLAGVVEGVRTILAQRDAAGSRPVLVSMAAGVSLAKLKGLPGTSTGPWCASCPTLPAPSARVSCS